MFKAVFDRFKKADPYLSLGNYVYSGVGLLGFSGAALMAWAMSRLTWFWQTFEWAGILFVGLIVWLLIGIGLNLYRSGSASPGGKKLDPLLLGAALAALALVGLLAAYGIKSSSANTEIASDVTAQTPINPAATLRRKYFGDSKQLFDSNLTKLTRILNGKGIEAVRTADLFLPRFKLGPALGFTPGIYEPFKTAPEQAAAASSEIYEEIWGKMLRENRDQIADLNDVIQSGDALTKFKTRMAQTVGYFNSFRIIYEKGDSETNNSAALLFSTLHEPTLKDAEAFHEWIEECNRRIEAKRRALENEK
jgi:hypothetical protein